ncbi:MAG: hypothetical protein M1812_002060 [Candelaria pacifica]|nr:MAG: hypothetical protein M1812_002060 [Candelaria pacifica]
MDQSQEHAVHMSQQTHAAHSITQSYLENSQVVHQATHQLSQVRHNIPLRSTALANRDYHRIQGLQAEIRVGRRQCMLPWEIEELEEESAEILTESERRESRLREIEVEGDLRRRFVESRDPDGIWRLGELEVHESELEMLSERRREGENQEWEREERLRATQIERLENQLWDSQYIEESHDDGFWNRDYPSDPAEIIAFARERTSPEPEAGGPALSRGPHWLSEFSSVVSYDMAALGHPSLHVNQGAANTRPPLEQREDSITTLHDVFLEYFSELEEGEIDESGGLRAPFPGPETAEALKQPRMVSPRSQAGRDRSRSPSASEDVRSRRRERRGN